MSTTSISFVTDEADITGIISGVFGGGILGIVDFFYNGGFQSGYYFKRNYLNLDFDRNNPSVHPFYKFKTSFYTDSLMNRFIDATYEYTWR